MVHVEFFGWQTKFLGRQPRDFAQRAQSQANNSKSMSYLSLQLESLCIISCSAAKRFCLLRKTFEVAINPGTLQ